MERLSKELLKIINEQDFCFTPQEMFAVRKAIGRLASYEDTGLTPEEIMTLKAPPNDPLTLEELQEMDGESVFCFSKRAAEDSAYGIACIRDNVPYVRTIQNKGTSSRFFYLTTYGTAWLAYRRKPKEVEA